MYELLYIIPAIYTEDELKNVTEKLAEKIKAEGAEIKDAKNLGRIKFAYPIKKQTVGYYILVDFSLPGEKLKKLNRELQLEKDILRFMVTKKIAAPKEVKIAEFKEAEIVPAAKEKKEKKIAKQIKEKEKMKLEDIEKELDTLLEKEII